MVLQNGKYQIDNHATRDQCYLLHLCEGWSYWKISHHWTELEENTHSYKKRNHLHFVRSIDQETKYVWFGRRPSLIIRENRVWLAGYSVAFEERIDWLFWYRSKDWIFVTSSNVHRREIRRDPFTCPLNAGFKGSKQQLSSIFDQMHLED